MIRAAGEALRGAVRDSDVVARIGGDEFAVLGLECDGIGAEALEAKVAAALAAAGVRASVGRALRRPDLGLARAVKDADRAMYAVKPRRGAGQRRGRG